MNEYLIFPPCYGYVEKTKDLRTTTFNYKSIGAQTVANISSTRSVFSFKNL